MFDEYRPHWAAAMALQGRTLTHLRSGWAFDTGYSTQCGSTLKTPKDTFWVAASEISTHSIAGEETNTRTCTACCLYWVRQAYEDN